MGCGGSTEKPPAQERSEPEKAKSPMTRKQKQREFQEQIKGFSFGDPDDEMDGTPGEKKHEEVPEEQKRRVTENRRRGVSQDIIDDTFADEDWTFPEHEKTDAQRQAALDCLADNVLFSSLLPPDLNRVVSAMVIEEFPQGTDILEQNKPSTDKYYIIQSGSVAIIKNDKTVTTFEKAQGFGELELMYSSPCAATVRTETDTCCLSIERTIYRMIIMKVSKQRQKQYIEQLKKVDFLSGLSQAEMLILADSVDYYKPKEGERLIELGTHPGWMYIILSGEARVMGVDSSKEASLVEVARLKEGDCVGELEFLKGHEAVANVVAESGVTTLRLHKQHFEEAMGPVIDFLKDKTTGEKYGYYNQAVVDGEVSPFVTGFTFGADGDEDSFDRSESTEDTGSEDLAKKHSLTAKHPRTAVFAMNPVDLDVDFTVVPKDPEERAVLKATVAEHALFKSLHEKELDMILDVMAKKTFAEGEVIMEQGSVSSTLYIILQGDAAVTIDGSFVCDLSKGATIGELELMYDQPCRATVTAKTELPTYHIGRGVYKKVVMEGVNKRREELRAILDDAKLFQNLEPDRLMMIADALGEQKFPANTPLLTHGETPEWMYLITSGTVDVVGRDDSGGKKLICEFGVGSIVGELEFLNAHATVADVVAKTDVVTGRLHRAHFERVLGSISDLMKRNAMEKEYEYYNQQMDTFVFGADEQECSEAFDNTTTSPPTGPIEPPPPLRTSKRVAVSAERVDDSVPFEPPVIEKTDEERADIENVLGKNILFSALDGDAQATKVVVDAMERAVYSLGDSVMTQNEIEGEHWYIIAEGEVDIVKNGIQVAHFKEGEGFGEMELMYTCKTAASVVVTTEKLVCWRLDRLTYKKMIMSASQRKRELCEKAMEKVSFLKELTQWQRDHLLDALKANSFDKGDVIIAKAREAAGIHIITHGKSRVLDGKGDFICELGEGELIGDLEFLHGHDTVADVYADTDVSTLFLSREHFEICLGPVKDVLEKEHDADEKYRNYRETYANKKRGAIDWDNLARKLPSDRTPEAKEKRKQLFDSLDNNGNNYLSLAEVNRGIRDTLQLADDVDVEPAIKRAFNAVKDLAPAHTASSDDYVTFREFRMLLVALKQTLEVYAVFQYVDGGDDGRVNLNEFRKAVPVLEKAGVTVKDPEAEFKALDKNGGGQVLFIEFLHWAQRKGLDAEPDDLD
eukprot:TRINITY_DN3219_c0_g2_i1.p1 TRINITY_DN3219_c0_g2~~TRINITY_DN3219_c0_g2_i1.p1  ORF type:complete len:1199 (+),score=443.58 TRINITY_DN3219_c0_g2_i1:170-3766(+)